MIDMVKRVTVGVLLVMLVLSAGGCMLFATDGPFAGNGESDHEQAEDRDNTGDESGSKEEGDIEESVTDEQSGSEDETDTEKASVLETSVYLPNDQGLWLERLQATVEASHSEADVELKLRAWLQEADFLPHTEAEIVAVQQQKAVISFCNGIKNLDIDYEGLIVTSLVNTLTGLDEIDEIRILVEEEEEYSLAGRSYIGEVLTYDDSLLAQDGYRPLAPSDPRRGESFIEGTVIEASADDFAVVIKQVDDGGSGGERRITVNEDAVVHVQTPTGDTEEVTLSSVQKDYVIGVIMTAKGTARGIIIIQ